MTLQCSDCRHFNVDPYRDVEIGECRLYPSFVNRYKQEWCGQFSGREEVNQDGLEDPQELTANNDFTDSRTTENPTSD